MPKTIVSISAPTPKWATWVFRIVFFATLAAAIIVAGDPAIPNPVKVQAMLWMKALDVFIWGIGRGLGVKKEDYEQ